jgi:hypothetical protein
MNESEMLLVCGLAVIGLIAIRMYMNGQQQKHEREHRERMKVLEMGQALPAQQTAPNQRSAYRLALVIGGVVPAGAFVSSAFASAAIGFHEAMWIATGMVGLGGVICGTVLASTQFNVAAATDTGEGSSPLTGFKPRVDDDAYDVVSARG